MKFAYLYIITALLVSIFLALSECVFPNRGLSFLFAVSPAMIAFVFSLFDVERPFLSLGWQPNFKYWPKILGTLLILTIILLFIALLLGHTEINENSLKKFLNISIFVELVVGILINTGEEAGWRGYLFPKLYKQKGWWFAILLSSIVWWAWHTPFMAVLQIRQFGEIQWTTQIIQFIAMLPATILLSYWFLRSQSFWAIGFAHQLSNFINKWFLGLEHTNKSPIFFTDKTHIQLYSLENGILGLLILSVAATYVYLKNKKFLVKKNF